jgi:hypothetical protein
MEQREADAYADIALSFGVGLLATLLDYNKQHAGHKIDPDWTWMSVAAGSGLCLVAARVRVRLMGATDREATERSVWRSFGVGGTVIAFWQIWRALKRLSARESALRHYVTVAEDMHAQSPQRKSPPATLAAFRRPGPQAN